MRLHWFKFLCWLDEYVIRHRWHWLCGYAPWALMGECEHIWLFREEDADGGCWFDCVGPCGSSVREGPGYKR